MTTLARRKRGKAAPAHSPVFWMMVGVGGVASALVIAGYLWRRAWGLTAAHTTPEPVPSQS